VIEMTRLDGIQLIQKIRNGKVKDGSKIKVFYDDGMFDESYVTVIEYKNNDIIWAPSTFKVSMLYDEYYSFEIIEDNDKTDEEAKPITKESIEALGYACGEIQKCFTSGWTKALENKPLKGNDKLEKIKWNEKESRAGILRTDQEIEVLAKRTETLKKKIAELVDHINKIEEILDDN
jgi:hypothetical protein